MSVLTKQQRIAALADRNPQMSFTSLAHHIDQDWLREAYRRTRKTGAVGVDQQTAQVYAANLEENLQSLLNRAKSGTYKAPPVRRVHIPKVGSNNETRPIGIPTFEDKAEALYYFPLFRTWFGLQGLCKIVWNDVSPADNKKYPPQEAAKIPGHVENYWKFFEGMTGIPLDEKKMLDQSARVHNLQKMIGLMLGRNSWKEDIPPYRAVGPVTAQEYESRQERYDKQIMENIKLDPNTISTEDKIQKLREYRMDQYKKVAQAAYKRRGWDEFGIPTAERLKELGIDKPELLEIIELARKNVEPK